MTWWKTWSQIFQKILNQFLQTSLQMKAYPFSFFGGRIKKNLKKLNETSFFSMKTKLQKAFGRDELMPIVL